MALRDVELPRNYRNGDVLFAEDLTVFLDAIEEEFATVNLNLTQVSRDSFSTGHVFDNDGLQNVSPSLQDQINLITSGGTPITGTTSNTFTINSDAFSSTLDTAALTASRVHTFPNIAGTFMVGGCNSTGAIGIPAAQRIYLDGVTLTGNTSIRESSADIISFEMGGFSDLLMSSGVATYTLTVAGRQTTGNCLDASASSLTSGSVARFYSNSVSVTARNLVSIINDNVLAVNASCVYIQQDADVEAILLSLNTGGGVGLRTNSAGITTGYGINFSNFNSLTSGQILLLSSNSADVTARNLVSILNDNALATGAIPLFIKQDASVASLAINHTAAGGNVIDLTTNALSITTGVGIGMTASSLTTGGFLNLYTNSADATGRNLVFVHNDNAAATGAVPLGLRQDAVGYNLLLYAVGGAVAAAFMEDGALLLPAIDPPTANEANGNGIVKAWLHYIDNSGVVTNSYNILSVTSDDGDGVYIVNVDTDFISATNNVIVGNTSTAGQQDRIVDIYQQAADFFRVSIWDASGAAAADEDFCVIAIGPQ